jgi:hypothetical protein
LELKTEDFFFIKKVQLAKGRLVKFQPHFTKFTELSNPKVVLERALRNYACLTKGDTIVIHYGDMPFPIDIIDVEPKNPKNAISVIDTDLNVDFEEPKDYNEYMEQKKREEQESKQLASSFQDLDTAQSSAIPINSPFFAGNGEIGPGKSSPAKSKYFSKLGPGHSLKEKGSNEPAIQNEEKVDEKSSAGYTLPRAVQAQTETVVKGQWKYIYSIDPKTKVKKLVKRVPNK